MLIEFTVANFRSFKDEVTLSMVPAAPDLRHPGNIAKEAGLELLKAAAVYGPNASGKSNLIKAMRTMQTIVRTSATQLEPNAAIPGIAPFRLDEQTATEPSRFDMHFLHKGVRYRHGFSATQSRIWDEWLYAWPKGHPRLILERLYDKDSEEYSWKANSLKPAELTLLRERTRDNCLGLSRAADLKFNVFADVYDWFSRRLWIFDLSQMPLGLLMGTADRLQTDDDLRARVNAFIPQADFGIERVKVEEAKLPDIPEPLREILEKLRRLAEEDGDDVSLNTTDLLTTVVSFVHKSKSGKEVVFAAQEESNGTIRFLALCGPVIDALRSGATVVVDEIGCSLHPQLTRKAIELFQGDANSTNAQLVFATHDLLTMDPALFRRDQIWLLEKNEDGASELFSLSDFKKRPRATEAFLRNYLAGRYGAVPNVGSLFDLAKTP